MKSFVLSSVIVLLGSVASAKTTTIVDPTYKCLGFGDGGGGVIVSIDSNSSKARVWTVDSPFDTEGDEFENTSLTTYRCPGCFTIKGSENHEGVGKISYQVDLRGSFTEKGLAVKMSLSAEGQTIIPDVPCEYVSKK